ncbi:MFS general substrate transporter [Clavulina sp. PMI_390]|nr:MFS general substrate transporter [Clavulina sp. PMI_390]
MIEYLGIAGPEDVGYYSGIVDSCFSFSQLFTIYFWSSLSDRIGRKPVIMIGVSGAALSAACFGFSTSLPMMVISRSIAGALSGNVAVVSSMLSEMTDETNQGKAFPLLGVTWYLGCIIGPMLGGNLSNPMKQWPETFQHFPIFQTYPYLLPCLVSSSFSVVAIIMCALFVEEVSPTPTGTSKAPLSPILPLVSSDEAETPKEEKKPVTVFDLLARPHIRAVLASGAMFSFLGVGFDVIFTLYSYTLVRLGGMGRTPTQIGWALAASGVVGIFSAIFVFPHIQRRFNNRLAYTFFAAFWAVAFAMMPLGNLMARAAERVGDETLVWIATTLILAPVRLAVYVYPLQLIIIKSSVEDSSHLGTMFGLQQTTSSIARGIAPAFISSLFAFSIDHREGSWIGMGGNLVWVVLVAAGVAAVPMSARVIDVKAPDSLLVADEEEGVEEEQEEDMRVRVAEGVDARPEILDAEESQAS